MLGLGAAAGSLAYLLFRRRLGTENLALGALLWWALGALAARLGLPGGAYLFEWPLVFALVAWAFPHITRQAGELRRLAVLSACAVPGIVLVSTTATLFHALLGVGFAPAVLALPALLFGLLLPHLERLLAPDWRIFPILAALGGAGMLAWGAATPAFDAAHPRPNHLLLAVDADAKKAFWVSADRDLDAFTTRFAGGGERGPLPGFFPPAPNLPFWKREIPAPPAELPAATVIADRADAGARRLSVRVSAPRGAERIGIYVEGAASLTAASVDGKPVRRLREGALSLHYYGPPPSGLVLDLTCASGRAVALRLVSNVPGLPGEATRPPGMMPRPPSSDATLVARAYAF
jgi:hypothetical protein